MLCRSICVCDANQGAGHVDHTRGNGAEVAQDPLSLPSGQLQDLEPNVSRNH
jgi:hypothetical protein